MNITKKTIERKLERICVTSKNSPYVLSVNPLLYQGIFYLKRVVFLYMLVT